MSKQGTKFNPSGSIPVGPQPQPQILVCSFAGRALGSETGRVSDPPPARVVSLRGCGHTGDGGAHDFSRRNVHRS